MNVTRYWSFFMLLLLLQVLIGCTAANLPVLKESIDAAGKTTTSVVGTIADASTAKEFIVHQTLQNRDRRIAEAHKYSGFKMKWTQIQSTTRIVIDGKETVITSTAPYPEVSYTPEANFNQRLPTEQSVNPGYGVLKDVAKYSVYGIVGWKGLDTIENLGIAALDAAGTDWGSGNTFWASGNGNDGSYSPVYEAPEVTK